MNTTDLFAPDDIRARGFRRLYRGLAFLIGGLVVGVLLFLVAKQLPEMRRRAGGQTIILLAVCFGGAVYGLAVCFHAAGLILRRSESAGPVAGIWPASCSS